MTSMFLGCIVCTTVTVLSAVFVPIFLLVIRFRNRIFGKRRGNGSERPR